MKSSETAQKMLSKFMDDPLIQKEASEYALKEMGHESMPEKWETEGEESEYYSYFTTYCKSVLANMIIQTDGSC